MAFNDIVFFSYQQNRSTIGSSDRKPIFIFARSRLMKMKSRTNKWNVYRHDTQHSPNVSVYELMRLALFERTTFIIPSKYNYVASYAFITALCLHNQSLFILRLLCCFCSANHVYLLLLLTPQRNRLFAFCIHFHFSCLFGL